MSGIAGRYQPDGLVGERSWAPIVSQLLKHRGPDGEGFCEDPCCVFIHCCLSLNGSTCSDDQPMTSEDESLWIVCDGAPQCGALRSELLQKGRKFKDTSDAEVLLRLYEDCGPEMVHHIHGAYAFAIYDRKKKSLLLVRDRFGFKPLYYAFYDGQVLFASEIKAILAMPGLSVSIDHQAVYDYLSWGYIPEPATGFNEIQALPKGSSLQILPDLPPKLNNYFIPEASQRFRGSLNEAVEAAAERLVEAVRRQQPGDVPACTLLSGGIDSGLVTAALTRSTQENIRTFTLGFSDTEYDETGLAFSTAHFLNTNHTLISARDWTLEADQAIDLLGHFDQPYADTSLFAMNLVTKGMREHGLRFALSGDGGDEAFGGYDFYRHLPRLLSIHHLPGIIKSAALIASQILLTRRSPGASRQLRRAIHIAQNPSPSGFLTETISYIPESKKEALVRPEAREGLLPICRLFEAYERGWQLEGISEQLTEGLFHFLLPGEMLKKTDMMSMKNSVEIRAPLLDSHVVDFALSVAYELKANPVKNKIVLRALARQWLPEEITRAKKHGFGIPLDILAAPSLKRALREWLLEPGAHIHAIVDPTIVEGWVRSFENGSQASYASEISREGLYQRLFFLFALEIWMCRHHLTW